jgi:SAM-dependent methyltransferase
MSERTRHPAREIDRALREIVSRWRRGGSSAEIAIMELLIASESVAAVEAATRGEPVLAGLLSAHAAGCEQICAMLRDGVDDCGADATVEEGVDYARRLFDWSVSQSEESSVALYSLGSADILARATEEVVRVLDTWGVFTPTTRALEIGCGIGRLLGPIAARVDRVVGVDVAPRMVEVARRRCAEEPRVEVRVSSGFDLADLAAGSLDLVYAVDSFPYVVEAGAPLVRALFAEVGRVLVPGGRFALCGYSYRGDDAADRAEVDQVARESGLEVVIAGERPFTLWNGLAFLLRRRG